MKGVGGGSLASINTRWTRTRKRADAGCVAQRITRPKIVQLKITSATSQAQPLPATKVLQPTSSTSSAAAINVRNDHAVRSGGGLEEHVASTLASAGSSGDSTSGASVTELLESAQRMMKVLKDQQASLRVMRVASESDAVLQRARVFQNPQLTKMGLLDSGATHALRQERLGEASTARSVKVTLANDQKTTLLQYAQGVLLSQDRDVQPIVPLGSVVKQLGYTFEWNARGCRLHHPEKESVQVFTRSSCPEVRECDALRLIAEIEGMKVEEAMRTLQELTTTMKSTRVGADGNLRGPSRDWRSYVKDYIKTGHKEDGAKAVMDASFMKDVLTRIDWPSSKTFQMEIKRRGRR